MVRQLPPRAGAVVDKCVRLWRTGRAWLRRRWV